MRMVPWEVAFIVETDKTWDAIHRFYKKASEADRAIIFTVDC
jgi:hypothetical protein